MLRRVLVAFLLVFGVALQANAQSNKAALLGVKFPTAKVRLDKKGHITSIQDRAAPSYAGSPADAAKAYLRDLSDVLDGEAFSSPEVREVAGQTIVQFTQEIGGVPVLGRSVTVFMDGGQPRLLNRSSRYLQALSTDELKPDFDGMVAEVIARQATEQTDKAESYSRLVLLPSGDKATLAYSVVTQEGLSYYRVFINAKSGNVLWKQDLLLSAKANVYTNNPGANQNNPTIEVDLPPLRNTPDADNGILGDFVNAFSCAAPFTAPQTGCTVQGLALPDVNGDLLFNPVLSPTASNFDNDPFSQVHMFYHVDQIHGFFQNLGATDESGQITLSNGTRTNLDSPLLAITDLHFSAGNNGDFDNAFFAGSAIVFGNGSQTDFSYDAEVIYHEYGHAVFSFKLGGISFDELGLDTLNGGMNEGSADVFSTLFTNNSALGEYVSGSTNGLRNVDNNRLFPGGLDGETHDDGEIWGGAYWEIKTRFEQELAGSLGGEDAARDLVARIYIAMLLGLPNSSDADFGEAGVTLIDLAQTIGDQDGVGDEASQIVKEVFQSRGILNAQAQPVSRIVPIDPPNQPSAPTCVAFVGPGKFCQFGIGQAALQVGSAIPVPGPLQYSAVVPPRQELTAEVDVQVFSGTKKYDVYINEGTPVEFTYDFSPSLFVNINAQQTLNQPSSILLQNPTNEPKTFFIAFGILSQDPQGFGVLPIVSRVKLQPVTETFFSGGGCSVSQENTPVIFLLLLALGGLYLINNRRRSVR